MLWTRGGARGCDRRPYRPRRQGASRARLVSWRLISSKKGRVESTSNCVRVDGIVPAIFCVQVNQCYSTVNESTWCRMRARVAIRDQKII